MKQTQKTNSLGTIISESINRANSLNPQQSCSGKPGSDHNVIYVDFFVFFLLVCKLDLILMLIVITGRYQNFKYKPIFPSDLVI